MGSRKSWQSFKLRGQPNVEDWHFEQNLNFRPCLNWIYSAVLQNWMFLLMCFIDPLLAYTVWKFQEFGTKLDFWQIFYFLWILTTPPCWSMLPYYLCNIWQISKCHNKSTLSKLYDVIRKAHGRPKQTNWQWISFEHCEHTCRTMAIAMTIC